MRGKLPPERSVYADASPLIGLARVNRLDLLEILPVPILVTEHVWTELVGEGVRQGTDRLLEARKAGLIAVVREGDPSDYPLLDAGEASTLSAARAGGGAVIVDDQKARSVLERDEELKYIPYLATVALLLLAKNSGAIDRVRPILDDLRHESFRMSQGLYEQVLGAAGEWSQ